MEQHIENRHEERKALGRFDKHQKHFRRFRDDVRPRCFCEECEKGAFAIVGRREMPPGFAIYFVEHKYNGKPCKWHKWINYAEIEPQLRKDFETRRGNPEPTRVTRRY